MRISETYTAERAGLRTLYCILIQDWKSAEVTALETEVLSNVDVEEAEWF